MRSSSRPVLIALWGSVKLAKEDVMALHLDHTIVPAHDKEESARFIAGIFGLEDEAPWGHFAPLKIDEALTLDVDNRTDV